MAKSKPKVRPYPKYQGLAVGGKVAWYFYRLKSDADKAAQKAKEEAAKLKQQGYDFGFQTPGTVTKEEGGKFAGLFKVVVP